MKRITKEDRRNSKLAADGFEKLTDEGLLMEYRRTGSEVVCH